MIISFFRFSSSIIKLTLISCSILHIIIFSILIFILSIATRNLIRQWIPSFNLFQLKAILIIFCLKQFILIKNSFLVQKTLLLNILDCILYTIIRGIANKLISAVIIFIFWLKLIFFIFCYLTLAFTFFIKQLIENMDGFCNIFGCFYFLYKINFLVCFCYNFKYFFIKKANFIKVMFWYVIVD